MNVVQLHPLEEAAKRHYGVTRDLHETGFVLSDGTFLNLSGGVKGRKTRRHSDLPDEIARALGRSGGSGLVAFLQRTGVIRVLPAFGIEVGRMPTVEAIAALVAGWKRAFGGDSIIVEITRPDGSPLAHQEIEDPEVDTLVEFMDAHFNSPSMGASTQRLQFFSDCVNWPEGQVDDLKGMISASETISRATFLKSVDPGEMKDLEEALGYERDSRKGLTMAKDWHVSYYKSTLRGCSAVYFKWSAIEHVFTDLACVGNMPAEEESTEMSGSSGKTFTLVEQSTKEAPFRDIQEGHPVLQAVERILDGPSHYSELEVGQKMTVRVRASGTSGIYSIWRTA